MTPRQPRPQGDGKDSHACWTRDPGSSVHAMTFVSPFFPRNGPHVEPLDYTFWARPGVPTTTSPGSAALAPASGCQGQAPLSWRMARSGAYGFSTLGVCGTHPQMAVRVFRQASCLLLQGSVLASGHAHRNSVKTVGSGQTAKIWSMMRC